MPKRANPFGELSPLQFKTHVGKKEVDLGVAQEQRMKSVYDKTRELLFRGSQKSFSDNVTLDANDNITMVTSPPLLDASTSLLPGQMCLDHHGNLTTPVATGSDMTEARMTTDEDMAVGMTLSCVGPSAPPQLPGQLRLDPQGHLVASTGVSDDKAGKEEESLRFPIRKRADACVGCRKNIPRGSVSTCRFCEQMKCPACSRECSRCDGDFCTLCTVLNYADTVEKPVCLNCS